MSPSTLYTKAFVPTYGIKLLPEGTRGDHSLCFEQVTAAHITYDISIFASLQTLTLGSDFDFTSRKTCYVDRTMLDGTPSTRNSRTREPELLQPG